ncbi:MAG: hypothetical protein PHC28_12405 [Flavobacterium sp.]|uniref:hypothetical protein n=1 Tax=Flavobacterium sp. TaxID=239 RepID=UPI0026030FEF|nr:hypothetical protein [Flavobacterium sp.]MDD5151256.1 hypothetical protein [Flavobacterium sp.]
MQNSNDVVDQRQNYFSRLVSCVREFRQGYKETGNVVAISRRAKERENYFYSPVEFAQIMGFGISLKLSGAYRAGQKVYLGLNCGARESLQGLQVRAKRKFEWGK